MNLTVLLLAATGLYVGGNWIVAGSSRLARSFGVPQVVIGLTLISLVTTTPELIVSLQASLTDADGLVLGMITGSNITNIGLILGVSGLLAGSLPIATGLVRRGVPVMVAIALVVYVLLFLSEWGRWVGMGLILVFLVFSVYVIQIMRGNEELKALRTQEMARVGPLQTDDVLLREDEDVVENEIAEHINRPFEFARAALGIIVLIYSADAIVGGVLTIVDQLGADQVLLGATLLALVTSAPELIAILAASTRGQPDVVFGTLIGASITNLLLVFGAAAFVSPITIPQQVIVYEYPVMLGLMIYMVFVAVDGKLSRFEAGLYMLAYAAFIAGFFFLPVL